MKKMSKFLVATLAATLVLCYSLPVLADTNTTGQTQTPTSQTSPQDKAATIKQKIQNEIVKLQQTKEIQPYMQQIQQLQSQEKDVRSQIKTERQTLTSKLKADRQAKNYDALIAGLNAMLPMQDDIVAAAQVAQTCKTDWSQLKADRTADNQAAITADLQKIQTDVQSRISAYQKILTDLQGVCQALDTPASTPSSASTDTSATNS